MKLFKNHYPSQAKLKKSTLQNQEDNLQQQMIMKTNQQNSNIIRTELIYDLIALRGGGCGSSLLKCGSQQTAPEINLSIQEPPESLPLPDLQQQSSEQLIGLPKNFIHDLDQYIKIIAEGYKHLLDQSKTNELIKSILWVINNREYLNKFCIGEDLYQVQSQQIKNYFSLILESLSNYLGVSWYYCYQVIQICNELLRIMYSHNKNDMMESDKRDQYLEQIQNLSESLNEESGQIWKTGIEFEIKILQIMLIHSNNEAEKEQTIDLLKNIGKSIIKMKITGKLIKSLKNSAKMVFQKGMEHIQYPIEVYLVYNQFQKLKWQIIADLKSGKPQIQQIKQLQQLLKQNILDSNNWMIHFCWIQLITDLIIYRPLIFKTDLIGIQSSNQNQVYQQWKTLFNIQVIKKLPYSNEVATLTLLDDQKVQFENWIQNFLITNNQQSLSKFCKYLQNGNFENIQFWDYYQKFNFKKEIEEESDTELILANISTELIQHQTSKLQTTIDDVRIVDNYLNEAIKKYFDEQLTYSIDLFQEEQTKLLQQLIDGCRNTLYILNIIKQFIDFEFEKVKLLYSQNLESQNQPKEEDFKKSFKEVEEKLITNFIQAIQKICKLKIMIQYLQYFKKENFEVILNSLTILMLEDQQMKQLQTLPLDITTFLIQFQEKYKQSRVKQDDLQQKESERIQLKSNQFQMFIQMISNGKQIQSILSQIHNTELQLNNLAKQSTILDIQQILFDCEIWMEILKCLKFTCQHQIKNIMMINDKISHYQSQVAQQPKEIDILILEDIQGLINVTCEVICQFVDQFYSRQNEDKLSQEFKHLNKLIDAHIVRIVQAYEGKQFEFETEIKACITKIQEIQIQLVQAFFKANTTDKNAVKQADQNDEQIKNYQNQIEGIKTILTNLKQQISNFNQQQQTKKKENTLNQNTLVYKKNTFQSVERTIQNILSVIILKKTFLKSFQKQLTIFLNIFCLNEAQNNDLLESIILFQQKHELDSKNLLMFINSCEKELSKNDQLFEINLNLFQFLNFYETQIEEVEETENQEGTNNIFVELWSDVKNFYESKKQKVEDFFEAKDYKVRQCFAFNLLRIQQSGLEQSLVQFATIKLQQMWVFEKDQRVRSLLKNKELVEMQKQFFQSDLETLQDQIKNEMKKRMTNIENLTQQIRLSSNKKEKELLQKEIELSYEELDSALDNITEMSSAMDISLIFLKDTSKDVKSIKTQIDSLQNSLNQIGDDIRKLRGKKYDELLEIRKQKIIQWAQQSEVDSIYVELVTEERHPIDGKIDAGSHLLKEDLNDKNGEVNEFIWLEQDKDVMLLSGQAGSGKSKAVKKIEEYIWKQKGPKSRWIPIYVSLPTLKNPKYNLFDQALESENYQFDKYQIREFKEAIQNDKEKIILILDSYDEMKQDCIQQNLIMTNKLFQDLNANEKNQNVKVIITTRREILNIEGYEQWFFGKSIQSLKEIILKNFDESQQKNYLNQYCELSVKRKIRGIYEFVKLLQGQNIDLAEFLKIWNSIAVIVQKNIKQSDDNNQDVIFREKQEEVIINKIRSQPIFRFLSEEQITTLKKDLQSLWNVKKFLKAIETVNIQNLLTTPFMLEIIVQVLPSMTKTYQGSNVIKQLFRQNYMKIIQRQKLSDKLKLKYSLEKMEINNEQKKKQNQQNDQPKPNDQDDLSQKNQELELELILDELDNNNFFQKYSIDSTLKIEGNNLYIDGISIVLNAKNLEQILRALKTKKFTAFEFYETFINFYHNQQTQKFRELGKVSNYESFTQDIHQFSQSLALDMTFRELSQISYKQKGQLHLASNYKATQDIDNWLDQYLSESTSDNEYKKLVRSCSLLNNKGSTYSFTHKSIQEFYVAYYIYHFLMSVDDFQEKENQTKIKERLENSLFNQSSFNITIDSFRGACGFVKDKFLYVDNINQKLIDIVLLSKKQNFIGAASNSIYLLSLMDVYLGSRDFNSIKLANTNISGLSFFGSNLSSSIFKNVNINSCNFNKANLCDVEWDDIISKEKPYLKTEKTILLIAMSPTNNCLACLLEDNNIQLWDYTIYSLIKNFPENKSEIFAIQFSKNSILAYCDLQGDINLWNIQNLQNIYHLDTFKTNLENGLYFQISEDGSSAFFFAHQQFRVVNLREKKKYFITSFQSMEMEKDIDQNWRENYLKIENISFSPDSQKVASFQYNSQLVIWNILTDETEQLGIIDQYVSRIEFSRNQQLLMCQLSNQIQIFDLSQNAQVGTYYILNNYFAITYSTFSLDSQSIIIAGDKAIETKQVTKEQNFNFQKECNEFQVHPIQDIAAYIKEKSIYLFDFKKNTSQLLNNFQLFPKNMIFSLDGAKLAFILHDGKFNVEFRIITIESNEFISLNWDHKLWKNYKLSQNFEKIIIQLQQNENREYNTYTIECDILKMIQIQDQNIYTEIKKIDDNKICFKNYSQLVALNSNNQIKLIDFDNNCEYILDIMRVTKDSQIISFCFLHEQQKLIIGNNDGQLFFWNYKSDVLEKKEEYESSIDFCTSPNGQLLAIYINDKVDIIRIIDWKIIKTFTNIQIYKFTNLVFSFDSLMIAFMQNYENFISLYNFQESKEIQLVSSRILDILRFSPINYSLYGVENQKLFVWNCQENKIIHTKQFDMKINDVCFSKSGTIIAFLFGYHIVQLWNDKFEMIGLKIFDQDIVNYQFILNDQQLLIIFDDCQLIKCSISSFIFQNAIREKLTLGAFSKDNKFIALVHNEIRIYQNNLSNLFQTIPEMPEDLEFLNNKEIIIGINSSTGFLSQKRAEIQIWNFHTKEIVSRQQLYSYELKKLQTIVYSNYFIVQVSSNQFYDNENTLMVWQYNLDQDKISLNLQGIFEKVNFQSCSIQRKILFGFVKKELVNLNTHNLEFNLELSEEGKIIKVLPSCDSQVYFIQYKKELRIYNRMAQRENKLITLEDGINDFIYIPQKLLLVIQSKNKISLYKNKFERYLNIYELDFSQNYLDDINNSKIFSTNNGEHLFLSNQSHQRWYRLNDNNELEGLRIFNIGVSQNSQNFILISQNNTICMQYIEETDDLKSYFIQFEFGNLNKLKTEIAIKFKNPLDRMSVQQHSYSQIAKMDSNFFLLSRKEITMLETKTLIQKLVKKSNYSYLCFQVLDKNNLIFIELIDKESKIKLYNMNKIKEKESEIEIGNVEGEINNLLYSQQNKILITSDVTQIGIQIWSIQAKQKIVTLSAHKNKITQLSLSRDGTILASIIHCDNEINLMNIQLDQFKNTQQDLKSITSIAYSFDGLVLACGNEKGQILLWDLDKKKQLLQFKGYKQYLRSLKFLSNKKLLISTGIDQYENFEDTVIKFWNLEYPYDDIVLQRSIKFYNQNKKMFLNQLNSRILLCGYDNLIQQWNYEQISSSSPNQINNKIKSTSQSFFISFNYLIYNDICEPKEGNSQEYCWKIMNLKNFKKQQILIDLVKILSTYSDKEKEIFILAEFDSLNENFELVRIVENEDVWIENQSINFHKLTWRIIFSPQMKYLVGESFSSLTIFDYEKYQSLKIERLNNYRQFMKSDCYYLQDISYDFSEAIIIIGKQLYLVDNESMKLNYQFCEENDCFYISKFSKDNDSKFLAALILNYQTIRIFERKKQRLHSSLIRDDKTKITHFEFSNNNPNIVIVSYEDNIIGSWNLEKIPPQFQQIIQLKFENVNEYEYSKLNNLVFSNDLLYVAFTLTQGKKIIITNLNENSSFGLDYQQECMAFSDNQQYIALGFQNEINIIKLDDMQCQVNFNLKYNMKIQGMIFTSNDNYILLSQKCVLSRLKFDQKNRLELVGIFIISHSIDRFFYNQNLAKVCVINKFEASILNLVDNFKMNLFVKRKESFQKDKYARDNGYKDEDLNKSICSFSSNGKLFAYLNPQIVFVNIQQQQIINKIDNMEGFSLTFQQFSNQEVLIVSNFKSLQFFTITEDYNINEIKSISFQSNIISFSLSENIILSNLESKEIIQHQIKVLENDVQLIGSFKDYEYGLVCKNLKAYAIIKEVEKTYPRYQYIISQFNYEILPIKTQKNETNEILCLSYSLSGQYIIIVSNQNINIFESENFEKLQAEMKFDIQGEIGVISQNSQYIAVLDKDGVQIYQIINEIEIVKKQQKFSKGNIIALAPKGDFLLTCNYYQKQILFVLWNVESGEEIAKTQQFGARIEILEFCVDGKQFTAGFEDGTVQIYQVNPKKQIDLKSDALENPLQYDIDFLKSIPTQSLLQAQNCKLNESSKINSSKISIKEIFLEKGAIEKK